MNACGVFIFSISNVIPSKKSHNFIFINTAHHAFFFFYFIQLNNYYFQLHLNDIYVLDAIEYDEYLIVGNV